MISFQLGVVALGGVTPVFNSVPQGLLLPVCEAVGQRREQWCEVRVARCYVDNERTFREPSYTRSSGLRCAQCHTAGLRVLCLFPDFAYVSTFLTRPHGCLLLRPPPIQGGEGWD